MKITQKAVRVYASAAYKDTSPHKELTHVPLTLEPLHLTGDANPARALVYFGEPVPWVLEAFQIRRIIGRWWLNTTFRGMPLPTDPDTAIAEEISQINLGESWHDPWYVTIVVEQDIDVTDSGITDYQYVWLVDDIWERASRFQMIAVPHIDRLALLASTAMSIAAFEKVVIEDHVYFAAPGRRTFGLPEPRMSARLQVSRPLHSLDEEALERRLHAALDLTPSDLGWLDRVTPWLLAGLREEDPWKAFMQLFTGLELLHEGLVKRYYDRVVGSGCVHGSDLASLKSTPVLAALLNRKQTKISSRRDLSQQGEFAVIALALFPLDADADFETFVRIKRLRNDVSHGDRTFAETTFPVSDLRKLLTRYLDAAIQEHHAATRNLTARSTDQICQITS